MGDDRALRRAEEELVIENSPEGWSERARDISDPFEVVGWSREGQRERFDAVLEAIHLFDVFKDRSLLDYGCGLGAFAKHSGYHGNYSGYDWSTDMVERARAENPGFEFDDLLPPRVFDIVVCIGTFNVPGSKDQSWFVLSNLWQDYCKELLVVSLYAGDDERSLRYSEEECRAFAIGAAPNYELNRHRHNDIILSLWR